MSRGDISRNPEWVAASNGAMGMITYALRGACMLAALASAGLWVRSLYVSDHYLWAGPRNSPLVDSRAVFTAPGRIVYQERSPFM